MMPVYKYICGCGYWWHATSADRHCPKCGGDELVSRVFLESEEAAILAALGALTFERDEAKRDNDELVVMVKKAQEERDYNKNTALNNAQAAVSWMDKCTLFEKQRDDARRWARHFYRLWKATQAVQFYPTTDAAMEYYKATQAPKAVTVKVTGLNHLQQAIEDAKPAVAEAMREAAQRTADRVLGKPTIMSKGRKAKVAK